MLIYACILDETSGSDSTNIMRKNQLAGKDVNQQLGSNAGEEDWALKLSFLGLPTALEM